MEIIFLILVAILGATISKRCADGGSCDDRETCCEIGGGVYGCCSYENAICCSDKSHCCPSGTKCDVSGSRCLSKSGLAFLEDYNYSKLISKKVTPSPADILKCIKDVIPFITDVKAVYEDLQKGDTSSAIKILPQLLKEGVEMTNDCKKLFS